jgi:hypothetical protein
MIDQFREKQRESLVRMFPATSGDEQAYAPPTMIRALTWMFLPSEESTTRKKMTQGFTRAALRCLKVR